MGFLFVYGLIVPAVLIVGGKVLRSYCPKKMNRICGYRTERSMKNMNTWRFAQEYCGRLWWKTGWIALLISLAVLLGVFRLGKNAVVIAANVLCVFQMISMFVCIYWTERALKKSFSEDGSRQSNGTVR